MPRLRWIMVILCFAATTINYIDRATVSVAAPFIARDLHLGPAVLGVVLSGFFWTYAAMQVPAGLVVDRLGPRLTYAVAVLWWSFFTAVTSVVNSAALLFGCRFALGVGEAGSYPCNTKVAAQWFPTRERGLASGIFDSGSRAGSALSMPLIALLISFTGWRLAFVVTGLVGVAWVVAWLLLYRDPDRHPGVTARELAALRAAQPAAQAQGAQAGAAVPFRALFRYRTVWGMMIGFFCLNFVFYFYTTWFPTYLVQARNFSLHRLGVLGMLPGLAAVPSAWIGGWTSDRLYRAGWSLTAARKTCLVGGMLLSSVITLSAFTRSDALCLAFFTTAYAGIALAGANIWSLPADVAPSAAHVASLSGIQNGAANLSGILTATMTGVILKITGGSFIAPLCITGGFCVLGAMTYLFVVGPIAPLPPLAGRTPAAGRALPEPTRA
ncbi:MFS transporter [Gluconacetobacter johannae]|uniref:MFS transporter n=1 Tax=Gluconacetobacter johannae TaxID=112140 RepID=A0A7W4J9Z2_9PROT|nr:MFS transporter [Gluconacetobacter johannae]MBB2177197.1 MFS transporter [Gluconacetobacter johannae]